MLLHSTLHWCLARVIRPGRERKVNQIGKKEAKLFLFANNTVFYIENLKESTKKTQSVRTNT